MKNLGDKFYTHDCDKCRYITRTVRNGNPFEWYVCGADIGRPVVIGRCGEGSEYCSYDVATLEQKFERPSLVRVPPREAFLAYSEELWVAWKIYMIWRDEL
jgi:hypothetical protein